MRLRIKADEGNEATGLLSTGEIMKLHQLDNQRPKDFGANAGQWQKALPFSEKG
ncbi:MAG: hypothetical protein R3E79_47950 [Caldilineaceae bacterium]